MRKVVLLRHETSDQGTFGKLLSDELGCDVFTGELPDHNNEANVSCIPAGVYRGVWTFSPRFKRNMYLIVPVDQRSGIRIHSANLCGLAPKWKKQLNGCISLGLRLGYIEGQKAVLLSATAIRMFEEAMKNDPFELEITQC